MCLSLSLPSHPSRYTGGADTSWILVGKSVMTNASLLISRDGQKSISWELLVVFKCCWTLNGWESSQAMCEQLACWEHLLSEEQAEIILFFFFFPISWTAGQWKSRKFHIFFSGTQARLVED